MEGSIVIVPSPRTVQRKIAGAHWATAWGTLSNDLISGGIGAEGVSTGAGAGSDVTGVFTIGVGGETGPFTTGVGGGNTRGCAVGVSTGETGGFAAGGGSGNGLGVGAGWLDTCGAGPGVPVWLGKML